jgi:hypothetical protein
MPALCEEGGTGACAMRLWEFGEKLSTQPIVARRHRHGDHALASRSRHPHDRRPRPARPGSCLPSSRCLQEALCSREALSFFRFHPYLSPIGSDESTRKWQSAITQCAISASRCLASPCSTVTLTAVRESFLPFCLVPCKARRNPSMIKKRDCPKKIILKTNR